MSNIAELTGLIEAVDAAEKACPIRNGSSGNEKCPKCRATSSEPCGPVVSAEYQVVQGVRRLLTQDPRK